MNVMQSHIFIYRARYEQNHSILISEEIQSTYWGRPKIVLVIENTIKYRSWET